MELLQAAHSNHFLKWYLIFRHCATLDFFREFWSESARILFLSQPLGAFSIQHTILQYIKVKRDFSTKNEKEIFCSKTVSQGAL